MESMRGQSSKVGVLQLTGRGRGAEQQRRGGGGEGSAGSSQGVENVYTQHQPLLYQTIESIVKGRLRDVDYPFVGNHFQHGRFGSLLAVDLGDGRPQDVVIFIVGGSTYEEARTVAMQNAANTGTRVILGGSVVLNSASFLKDLEEVQRIGRTSVI